jgi:UPF0755 protein
MTIAEELRKERAAARAAAARDVNELRGIDDLDSLDQLDLLGWEDDPWDQAVAAGTVERLRTQTRSLKWLAYSLMVLAIVAVLVAGGVGWWYVGRLNPEGEPTQPVSFTVEATDTLETLSARLEQGGFITDAGVFRWYVERNGGLELTPGYYELPRNDHMGNVLARLGTPPSQTYTKVTFPEGLTLAEMAVRLDNTIVPMTVADFHAAAADPAVVSTIRPDGITSLEGLLFPDTYQVSNAESEAQVIERMIAQMERVASQEDLVPGAERLGRTPYEILIIASMIEEEARSDADRAKIARVIYNRLGLGMPLQIDAAVRYQTVRNGGDPQSDFVAQRETPGIWNTYLNTGLPATPITNPGRASIQAALNPAPNPGVGDPICVGLAPQDCRYLYYVLADEEGNHIFAATGEQHEINVQNARAAGVLD